MPRYPLLFGYRDLVSGTGFVAGVQADGRALLVEEDEEFWVYGVNPGGIAGHGNTWEAAHEDFRRNFKAALFDLAIEAQGFDEFRRLVTDFFEDTNAESERDWDQATREISSVEEPWLQVRKVTDHPPRIEINEVSSGDPSANELDERPMAACA